jgi:hypothetical protein
MAEQAVQLGQWIKAGLFRLRRAGTSRKEEKRYLPQEWCSAVRAAHPSSDGLRLPVLEVRRSLPYQETAGAAVHVSSHCYHASWYNGNRQIHDDLGVPYYTEHIRSLTESIGSKVVDVGKSLFTQLGRHLL